jgi:5'-nucleotidase
MRILISNDDGIDAPGIAALVEAAKDLGDVVVVAPDSVQSGAGHGITVSHPLTAKRHDFRMADGSSVEAYSVNGRPADCVRLGVRKLVTGPVDLVLSGINKGANDGVCVFYSGTVAAAAEACLLGIPAVALSAQSEPGGVQFERAGELAGPLVEKLIGQGLVVGDFLNVNFPRLSKPEFPVGVRVARQNRAELKDYYETISDDGTETIYQLGPDYDTGHDGDDTDSHALRNGYITVTPLRIDMTAHDRLGRWDALNE